MFYSVHIELLNDDGSKLDDVTVRRFPTQEEATYFIRKAIYLTGQLQEPMVFSLREPTGRLLMSFRSTLPAVAASESDDQVQPPHSAGSYCGA